MLRRVRAGEFADRAWERLAPGLSARDRAWTQELVYGTLRLRSRMDHVIAARVRGGLGKLEPDVLDVLRLGAYQLREMGGVPAYAAISQSVELVRAAGAPRAAGLVNGVLHAVAREGDGVRFPDWTNAPAEFLATWGSHPRWLVDRWLDRWGAADTRALVEHDNRTPSVFLQPVGPGRGDAAGRLAHAGIAVEPAPLVPGMLRLGSAGDVERALAAIPATVQDPAARLVVDFAAVRPGMLALDLCAAPGGKAVGLADAGARVLASDLSPHRLARVREHVSRLGWADRIQTVVADARRPPLTGADLVLIDVPCTGTGTLRRHPDARWRVGPPDLESLGGLQAEILHAAAGCVRPGGWLVYSTCSLEPEENEVQITRFLAAHPDWNSDPVPGAVPPELVGADGWLRVLPHHAGTDGAFAARLRRAA